MPNHCDEYRPFFSVVMFVNLQFHECFMTVSLHWPDLCREVGTVYDCIVT